MYPVDTIKVSVNYSWSWCEKWEFAKSCVAEIKMCEEEKKSYYINLEKKIAKCGRSHLTDEADNALQIKKRISLTLVKALAVISSLSY